MSACVRAVVLATLLAANGPGVLAGQSVRGRVLDDSTHDPLAGVLVEVVSTSIASNTDATGSFQLQLSRPGLIRLRLTLAGYAGVTSDTIRVVEGSPAIVVLQLERTAIPLDTIVAAAESMGRAGGFYERARQQGGFGQFITRADIAERPSASQITELLRGMRGVEVVPVRRQRSSFTYNTIVMNGALGRCQPMILLDGSRVRVTPDGGIDDFVKPDMLEGVEIYARSVSAPEWFAAPPTCGVIAFWSRTGSGEGAQKWTLKRVLTAAGIAAGMLTLVIFGRGI